jgi:hypothetical protein
LTRCRRQREISRSERSSSVGSQIAGTRSRNDSSARPPRINLVGLAGQRREPLDHLRVGDQHLPPMRHQLIVDEPGAVHRLHHRTHRLAKHRHPASQAMQTVTISDRREPVDQLPLIGDQAHLNPFTTEIQTNMQHECSSF